MELLHAFERNAVEGILSDPDRVIETVLSKLFVHGDRVHKVYKRRTADFADLADHAVRRAYISEDFLWNHTMAPDVYLELREVRRDGDQYRHVDDGEGEDLYLVMRRIDTSRDLITRLRARTTTPEELRAYVHTLNDRLDMLTELRAHMLREFFDRRMDHVRDEILGTCEWAYTAEPTLSRADVDRARALLEAALDRDPYFRDLDRSLSVVTDVNGENILFSEDGVSFIDVMPPKDAWRVHDRYFLVCRTSADVAALTDRDLAEHLHAAYAERTARPSRTVRLAYELAGSLIQVPYRKMLAQEDLAERYAAFVRRCMQELEEEQGQ
ncbi:MAG TPA: hypothetical protein VLB83_05565 [Candidatus Paceibacterota bacterium]|nr:hypothetical protein [Candidatus Paceibacterota bacterium]